MKYIIDCTGTNGYGRTEKAKTIQEVKYIIEGIEDKYYYKISVFDNQLNDFIYWKDILTSKAETDLINNLKSDLRTKTRLKIN